MGLTLLDLSEARSEALKARKPLRPKARFDAARRDRTTGDWIAPILSFNQELGLDQEAVVGRSRNLAQNDTAMAKFLSSVRKYVFGPDGITFHSKVMLQRGQKPAEEINKVIEAAWMEWCEKENCTLDQRMSWCQVQHFLANEVPTDGEAFIRKVVTRRNIFGFCIQVISTDQIDRAYGRNRPEILPGGNSVFMGIEMDGDQKVVAYHVFTRHPSEYGQGPKMRERIPADEIVHIYRKDKAAQVRGIPWAACSMFAMNMLAKYKEAELVASRMAASASIYITQETDPNADYAGETPADQSPAQADIPWEPGMVGKLSPGQSVNLVDPTHPTSQYGQFVGDSKLDIAAGLGISNMTLSGDVSQANYSSARVGLLDERDEWETLQYFFIAELCTPIFKAWLKTAFIAYPGFRVRLASSDWEDYDSPEWHPRSFPWVDPEKDANAVKLKLQTGLTTLTRELAAIGQDFDETMLERKKEQDKLKELGMEPLLAVYAPDQKVPTDPNANAPADTPPAKKPAPRDSQMVNLTGNLTEIVMSVHKGSKPNET